MKAKKRGKEHYEGIAAKFVAKYGDDVFELEALPPETLQALLVQTIDGVIDVDNFNAEIDAEKADAWRHLDTIRQKMKIAMQSIMEATPMNSTAHLVSKNQRTQKTPGREKKKWRRGLKTHPMIYSSKMTTQQIPTLKKPRSQRSW